MEPSSKIIKGMPQPEKVEVPEAPAENKPVEPKPVIVIKKPMQVMATRAGFYKQNRYKEGDKFIIDGIHHLGSWMKKI